MHDVVRLGPDEIPAAGETLAQALFDDALAVHMVPDNEERKAKLARHFAALVRFGVLFGEVFANAGAPDGVAVWLPPGQAMTRERVAASGMDAAAAVLGGAAVERLDSAVGPINQLRQEDMPAPHWYLAIIGVRPEHQGRGLGAALMAPVLSRADADGVACYLETAEPDNVPFYRKQGFVTLRQGVVPAGVPYWTMRRDPVGG
jgi:GNAT superfamily N-acetyltransferase